MFVMTKRQMLDLMEGLPDDAPVVVYEQEYGEWGTPTEACRARMSKKGVASTIQDIDGVEFAGWQPDPKGVECVVIGWSPENG